MLRVTCAGGCSAGGEAEMIVRLLVLLFHEQRPGELEPDAQQPGIAIQDPAEHGFGLPIVPAPHSWSFRRGSLARFSASIIRLGCWTGCAAPVDGLAAQARATTARQQPDRRACAPSASWLTGCCWPTKASCRAALRSVGSTAKTPPTCSACGPKKAPFMSPVTGSVGGVDLRRLLYGVIGGARQRDVEQLPLLLNGALPPTWIPSSWVAVEAGSRIVSIILVDARRRSCAGRNRR